MNAPDPFRTNKIVPLAGPPAVFLHCALFVAQRVISDETLRLVSFTGKESISEPFEFELELHGNTLVARDTPLSFADLIGRPVTIGIQTAALDASGQQPTREAANAGFQAALDGQPADPPLALYNGIVASFAIDQPGVYRLSMRPALWKLSLTNAYHVHAQQCIRDVISALLDRHHIEASVVALVGSDNPAATRIQDWLQAGETDDELLRRLMARAHIYYYFVHTARSHKVVFANRPAYAQALPAGVSLRYCDTRFEGEAMQQSDTLTHYSYKQSLSSGRVDSVITRGEAAWEADTVARFHSYRAASGDPAAPLPFKQYQMVQYGGSDAEVYHLTHSTQDALDAASRELSGGSLCPLLRCGHKFGLTQSPRSGQQPAFVRPELEGRSFVLTQVQHQASQDGSYRNEFVATDAGGLVTAFSLHDTQQGSLLGEVVSATPQPMPADWRYGKKTDCSPESSSLTELEKGQPVVLAAQGLMVRLSTAADDAPPVWIKLAAHMQTAPERGATVLITRAQDQTELPEIQSTIQSNVSQVIMPSGWTANTNVGSNYSTSYGDGKSIRFGSSSKAELDKAVGIVDSKYRSGEYREVSFSQGASYSYATAEQGAAGLLSRSDSFGSTYSNHTGTVSSSSSTFENTDNTSVVTGKASSDSTHAVMQNTSKIGAQNDMSLVGATNRMSITGVSDAMSMVGVSSDLSIAGANSNISIKGAGSSIEMTGAGVNIQLAARTFVQIQELNVTL